MDLTKYHAKPNKTIQQHNEDLEEVLSCLLEYGYIPSEYIFRLVRLACLYHDYGKVNPEFQRRVKSDKKILFNENKEVAHNVLSLFFLPKDIFQDVKEYYMVGQAILNHHDYCDTFQVLQDAGKKELMERLLNGFQDEVHKVGRRTLKGMGSIKDDKDAVLIKGFLHKCDYSASAGMRVEYPNDFLIDKLEGLGYQWNELQLFCKKNSNKNIIAIAQTGMGKTEGGLNWIGNEKGFFILPIRTAINAIYDRVRKNVLKGENVEERVALLHSGALDYYHDNLVPDELDVADYFERGKRLSMPLTVCTMDQLFDFVFKYNGYEMKLSTLSYSKIVLDEIQMYSPDLLAYLICGIKKISEVGGKLAVVTATLPPFVRDEIVQALGQDIAEDIFLDDSKRHHVRVFSKTLEAGIICRTFQENELKNKSNKVLVVCNTVKKAQEIFQEIKDEISDHATEIRLLHSRFIKEDRARKETDIIEFGKTYCDEEKKEIDKRSGIWIATSVVEASLDIDFDYLFTELSDLNALFQRFGRCNRKGVKSIEEPNCYVFTEVNIGKNLDKTIYELSKGEIEQVTGILDEKKKVEMINRSFTRENVCRSEYYSKYIQIREEIDHMASHEVDKKDVQLRNIMSVAIIPEPIYIEKEPIIRECLEALEWEGDPVKKAKHREIVRSFTVSIPSYIIHKRSAYVYHTIPLGKYETIPIFECDYSEEIGFRELEYSTYKRPTNVL